MSKTQKTEILNKNSPILRKMAKHVPIEDITKKETRDILRRMATAMHGEEDGVAIAAPQIGESLRIFLVNTKALASIKDDEPGNIKRKPKTTEKDLVFINPEIVKLSKTKKEMEEGCLSLRWLYGRVLRSEKATVKAYDEYGKPFQMGASGIMAQIFQHEIDHLDGILFTDKASDLEDLPPNYGQPKL